MASATDEEITKLIHTLKSSPGYDDILASNLKLVTQIIYVPVEYLCNRSLLHGLFPSEQNC